MFNFSKIINPSDFYKQWIRTTLFSLILFFLFEFGFLGLSGNPQFGESSFIVLNRLEQTNNNLHPLYPLIEPVGETSAIRPYRSQFALQGILIAGITQILGLTPLTSALIFSHIFCILLSISLGIFFSRFVDKYGFVAVLIAVILTGFSPWFYTFSFSLYWTTFVWFFPIVFSQIFYPKSLESSRNKYLFIGGLIFLVFLKSLCGYEYITTVIISALVPIIFYHLEQKNFSKNLLIKILAISLLCCLGFVLAILIHSWQINTVFSVNGIEVIMGRVRYRTVASIGEDQQQVIQHFIDSLSQHSWLAHFLKNNANLHAIVFGIYAFFVTLTFPAFTIPFSSIRTIPMLANQGFSVSIGLCILLSFIYLIVAFIKQINLEFKLKALILTTNISLLAPFSWQVLAFNHMSVHPHINGILFYLPFLLLFYLITGYLIQKLWLTLTQRVGIPNPKIQKILLYFVTGFLTIGLITSFIQGRVYKQMSTIISSNPSLVSQTPSPSIKGAIDLIEVVDNNDSFELKRSLFNVKVKNLRLQGWAFDIEHLNDPIKLLVVNQGTIVDGQLNFSRRNDVNQALKIADSSQVGFTFIAPLSVNDVESKALIQNLKIYAVSSRNPSQFLQLK